MSNDYKLYYFDLKGRGELSRLIFAQAGVRYKDIRFDHDEWKTKYGQMSPFGTCPWLEVDGEAIGGSIEIGRFLGETFGLAGENGIQNAQIAGISDTIGDFLTQATNHLFVSADKKKETMDEFIAKASKWLNPLEERVQSISDGWLYGSGKLTWVDIFWSSCADIVLSIFILIYYRIILNLMH